MTADANAQLARDYFTAFAASDEAWWSEHIAEDFVRHDPGLPFEVRGIEGVRKLGEFLHGNLSQIELPIVETVAQGDSVLVHLRVKAIHSGDDLGIPATGKPVNFQVMDLFHIRDGKLTEHWALMDNLGMLQQIGAI